VPQFMGLFRYNLPLGDEYETDFSGGTIKALADPDQRDGERERARVLRDLARRLMLSRPPLRPQILHRSWWLIPP
jgi:hypothetical protein